MSSMGLQRTRFAFSLAYGAVGLLAGASATDDPAGAEAVKPASEMAVRMEVAKRMLNIEDIYGRGSMWVGM